MREACLENIRDYFKEDNLDISLHWCMGNKGNKVIYDKDGKPVGSIYESDKEALRR